MHFPAYKGGRNINMTNAVRVIGKGRRGKKGEGRTAILPMSGRGGDTGPFCWEKEIHKEHSLLEHEKKRGEEQDEGERFGRGNGRQKAPIVGRGCYDLKSQGGKRGKQRLE